LKTAIQPQRSQRTQRDSKGWRGKVIKASGAGTQ
jgi:hypothetical protein